MQAFIKRNYVSTSEQNRARLMVTLCQKSRRTLKICKFKALCLEYCFFNLYTSHIIERNPQ